MSDRDTRSTSPMQSGSIRCGAQIISDVLMIGAIDQDATLDELPSNGFMACLVRSPVHPASVISSSTIPITRMTSLQAMRTRLQPGAYADLTLAIQRSIGRCRRRRELQNPWRYMLSRAHGFGSVDRGATARCAPIEQCSQKESLNLNSN